MIDTEKDSIGLTPIKIETFNDINYRKILEDYEYHFCQTMAIIHTNYKKLESFNVYFESKQLPHLMGWDKILNSKLQPKRINSLIKKGEITVESTRKHKNFNEAKRRMTSYNYFHNIFIWQKEKICVMTNDMSPNSMKLDVVFYKENRREATILGLRKAGKMDYFVPTTLHNRSLRNPFAKRRRTFIKSVDWK